MQRRVAFVSAGANGVGFAVVRTLLEAGWDVAFTYRSSRTEAEQLVNTAHALGVRAVAVQADLLVQAQVEAAVRQSLAEFGRIDALVHNFGPFVFERIALADYSDDMWRRMMDGNLSNFLWMYRLVVDGMRKRAFGRIVTVGFDGAGRAAGWRYRAAYAAAKSGLASLTRSIAREERQSGITANMVCPGDVRGPWKTRLIREAMVPADPLSRPAVGGDIARIVAFLCHEDSHHVSGTVTEVTGGYDILAYDDGQDVVNEARRFAVGDKVWVFPWGVEAEVESVNKVPNRYAVYTVRSGSRQGTFTMFQLSCGKETEDGTDGTRG
ncbi:MAG: SDR family oxidoreductase [Alicyclobacillus herbarius]|uniref:SDR family oxidoreductase n=1 Tax=Alicyclobacillus herbarius TaxID=122960 RepID=UPI00041168F2|nr:SDR family oxidoreductase [Alicyclobacillus herbarius]MCL6631019.1 SDR family oxidoreductase [Alicyclobacillus herbarius]